jgi:hypothetical protein
VIALSVAFLMLAFAGFCAYMADRQIRMLEKEIRGE